MEVKLERWKISSFFLKVLHTIKKKKKAIVLFLVIAGIYAEKFMLLKSESMVSLKVHFSSWI